MPARLIRWSIENRVLVVIATLILAGWGWVSVKQTPLDAIPDLSDVQIIIRTNFAGQSPRVVEEQVTYPITTTMLAVPGARAVRGYSFFGDSYVYVIFDDGTDLYWARSRVLEYLNQAAALLPAGVQPRLGPDASGVGWIYTYALVLIVYRLVDVRTLRGLENGLILGAGLIVFSMVFYDFFLRLGFVVGHAGLARALLIIGLANGLGPRPGLDIVIPATHRLGEVHAIRGIFLPVGCTLQ